MCEIKVNTTLKNNFTKYQSHMRIACQKFTFMTLDKLLLIPEDKLTKGQKNFKRIYVDNCTFPYAVYHRTDIDCMGIKCPMYNKCCGLNNSR